MVQEILNDPWLGGPTVPGFPGHRPQDPLAHLRGPGNPWTPNPVPLGHPVGTSPAPANPVAVPRIDPDVFSHPFPGLNLPKADAMPAPLPALARLGGGAAELNLPKVDAKPAPPLTWPSWLRWQYAAGVGVLSFLAGLLRARFSRQASGA
jgi:hypothetical protein